MKSFEAFTYFVINMASKGGAIVIMKKSEYNSACEKVLNDRNSYSELPVDPNHMYRKKIDK